MPFFGEEFDAISLLDQLSQHDQGFDPAEQPYKGLSLAMDGHSHSQLKVRLCRFLTEWLCPRQLFLC